jgi:hypothetical protein
MSNVILDLDSIWVSIFTLTVISLFSKEITASVCEQNMHSGVIWRDKIYGDRHQICQRVEVYLLLKCIWHEFFYFLKWKNSLSCSVTYFSVSCFYGLFQRYFNLFGMQMSVNMSANLWRHVGCKLFKMVEYHGYHPR